jgi:poly(beta-D-mannuronate) lyase
MAVRKLRIVRRGRLGNSASTIRILCAFGTALLGFFAATAQAAGSGLAGLGECPDDPSIIRVEAKPIYSDPKGSIFDPEKLHRHAQQIMPLRKFVTDASERADGVDRGTRNCALSMMSAWAKAGAMAEAPTDFGGLRELERFTISLNIIALKLRADGLKIDPLLGWLGNLNHTVIDRFAERGRVDNLYVWSGVAAASYALLKVDDPARRYEDAVWIRAVSVIRPDGFVDSELRRGSRTLSYHAYDLSALLTLRALRTALGEPLSGQDRTVVMRLVDRVGSSLCDPSQIVTASGGMAQETSRAIEFAPLIAFAGDLADGRLSRCGPPDIPTTDPILGGNLDRTAKILTDLGRRAH